MDNATALLICVAILVLAARPFVGYWRGRGLEDLRRRYQTFWPYGAAALEGWLRAQLVIYAAGCLLTVGLVLALLLPAADQTTRSVLTQLGTTIFVALVITCVLVLSIVLFNEPRRLSLPALRNQEGVVSAWWRQRRHRNAAH